MKFSKKAIIFFSILCAATLLYSLIYIVEYSSLPYSAKDFVQSSFFSKKSPISLVAPSPLKVLNDGDEIRIYHEVPFNHTNICDLSKQDTKIYKTLRDFDMDVQVTKQPLIETMLTIQPYLKTYIENNTIKTDDFFIPVRVGDMYGYNHNPDPSGCDYSHYYFPIEKNGKTIGTLVVMYRESGELSDMQDPEILEKIHNIPGLITSQKAREILHTIIKSISISDTF